MRAHFELHNSVEGTLVVHREVYNKILVNTKNRSLRKVNSVKKYAWVLQQKDKMGTVLTTRRRVPFLFLRHGHYSLLFTIVRTWRSQCLLLYPLLCFLEESKYCLRWFHLCSIYWSYVNSKFQPAEIYCSRWSASTIWYKVCSILIIHLRTKYQIPRCKE
jgi:hypothetical protein